MPRELETFRDNLARLNDLFPDRELFTRKDIQQVTGLSHCTVPKEFPFAGRYISKVNLARMLAMKGAPT